jgi:hypothetical protein
MPAVRTASLQRRGGCLPKFVPVALCKPAEVIEAKSRGDIRD